MNTKRLILAVVAVFIGVFATDYLIHEVWLHNDYVATASLWRPKEDMGKHFPFLVGGQFLASLMFVLIWAHADIKTIGRACAFGLCMGLAKESTTLVLHAVQPFPADLAAKWFIAGAIQATLMGAVAFFTYGSSSRPPSSAPAA
jgi:hypothetical protein